MTLVNSDATVKLHLPSKHKPWKSLLAGSLAHLTHDGFSDTLYVFFPLWQAQFGLSFAEVGSLKTLFSGSLAIFQVPAGYLASRTGEIKLLLIGTTLTCLSVGLFSWATTPLFLGLLLVIGGLGESVQHPLSSSIISNAYPEVKARRKALSTFNVAGDIGKMVLPAIAALLISQSDWQTASKVLAILGLVITILIFTITRSIQPITKTLATKNHQWGYWAGKVIKLFGHYPALELLTAQLGWDF